VHSSLFRKRLDLLVPPVLRDLLALMALRASRAPLVLRDLPAWPPKKLPR